MGDIRYMKIRSGRKYPAGAAGGRGFRLNPKRFSVQKIRERFVCLFRLLSRWRLYRFCYGKAVVVRSLVKRSGILLTGGASRPSSSSSSSSQRRSNNKKRSKSRSSTTHAVSTVKAMDQADGRGDCRCRASFARSTSFYSEAIADCLEFIKQKQACPTL